MKKMSTLLAALVMLATSSLVQAGPSSDPNHSHINLGAKAGINIASFSTTIATSGSGTKFMGGVFGEYHFSGFSFGQIELNYVGKSAGTASFDFIMVPLLYKAKFDTNSSLKPYLMVGPEFGFRVSSAITGTKSFDFGATFGGGVEYWFNPTMAFLVEARYALGLANLTDIAGSSLKTRGINILGGLSFAL